VRRRSLVAVAAATLIAFAGFGPPAATAAPNQDPRAQQEQVRAEAAQLASQIDTTKASLSQIDAALNTLDNNLRSQEAALSRTENEVAQADQDIVDAKASITKLTRLVAVLRNEMRSRAVRAYTQPTGDDMLTVLQTKDFTTASSRKFFIELRAQSDADVSDQLTGAQSDLEHQRQKATKARATAEAKRAEQKSRTDAVRLARKQQSAIASSLEATINTQIDRSVSLSATDRNLSTQIAEQQAALQARLLAAQAAQAAAAASAQQRAAAAAAAAASAAASRPNTPAASPAASPAAPPTVTRITAPPTVTRTTTPAPSNQTPNGKGETTPLPPVVSGGGGTGSGGIKLCTVGGITVNCAIQGQLSAMMNAARGAGVNLAGGGYRDPAEQIALRQSHCGSSYYAIYQMSSSSCRPPTAIPGTSQHEIGLAIDFSNCSRGGAVFSWLSANAKSFGFYNLPSESWHWSTTGN
jgi:septal ring factor EnvC (AmiA/AmiB activator)